jgi:hypothetical protein
VLGRASGLPLLPVPVSSVCRLRNACLPFGGPDGVEGDFANGDLNWPLLPGVVPRDESFLGRIGGVAGLSSRDRR